MIFIVVKFTIRADRSDEWLALNDEYTQAVRSEEGNLFFEWSRSAENPDQFIVVEAFESREAGEAHVKSEHFHTWLSWVPDLIATTPEIIHVEVPQDGWGRMGEVSPRQ